MGQIVSSMHMNVAEVLSNRRKRKRSTDSSLVRDEQTQLDTTQPKMKKLLTTTQYIYKTLFKEEKNSDVAVKALDKVWHLHKVYLSQSPYFYRMFNGSWQEAQQNFIEITTLDEQITVASLDVVFGSMYSDEIEIELADVISVLATATLFHLDRVIDKCAAVMVEDISPETAIHYYDLACQYGVVALKKSTFEWFQINLPGIYSKKPSLLRHISIELMSALTASPDLYLMPTEFALYKLLRTWMFLCLHPDYDPEDRVQRADAVGAQELLVNAAVETYSGDVIQWAYFTRGAKERSFLATPEGQPYMKVFQKLRTQYLIIHYINLKTIFNDNIIPKEWLYRNIHNHWDALLRIDHGQEDCIPQQMNDEQFLESCMRCGRMLLGPGLHIWRWPGFNYGMELILQLDYRTRSLNIRRNHQQGFERVLSQHPKRKLMVRTTVTSVNARRQPIFTQTSGICTLSLQKNEEVPLMVLDPKLVHPLLISVNMMVAMPSNPYFKDIVPLSEEATSPSSDVESEVSIGHSEP